MNLTEQLKKVWQNKEDKEFRLQTYRNLASALAGLAHISVHERQLVSRIADG